MQVTTAFKLSNYWQDQTCVQKYVSYFRVRLDVCVVARTGLTLLKEHKLNNTTQRGFDTLDMLLRRKSSAFSIGRYMVFGVNVPRLQTLKTQKLSTLLFPTDLLISLALNIFVMWEMDKIFGPGSRFRLTLLQRIINSDTSIQGKRYRFLLDLSDTRASSRLTKSTTIYQLISKIKGYKTN